MIKKIIFVIIIAFGSIKLYAQIKLPPKDYKCGCPPLTLGVYDTKVNFSTDSSVEKDNYSKAQESGNYLENIYAKQQSDQLKVVRVPKRGTLNDIDFKTNAEISRSGSAGNYTYDVSVQITDAYTQAVVKNKKKTTNSLTNVNDMIDSCVAFFNPVLDNTIRKYQKKLRKESNNTKWIGLQWQVKPGSKKLKKNKATTVTITVTDCVSKTPVPKLPIHITQTNPNTGILNTTNVNTNDSGKVAVIFTAMNKGETIIIPSFSYTGINNKVIKDPIACAAPKITVGEDFLYKITMDAENTLAETGEDIKLLGECTASLKTLDDGTFMLEPVDKTRNMKVTVEQNKIVNAGGAVGQIVIPQQYVFPFLFSIGKMDKDLGSGEATVYLNTTAPQTGTVKSEIMADGKTVTTIVDIDKGSITTIAAGHTGTYQLPTGGMMYAMDAVTHLNLLSGFASNINTTMQNTNRNIASAQQKMEWAKRMQAHQNDPAYFKTAQGKKDMEQMQALQQQLGGNIKNEGSNTTAIRQAMTKKMEKDPNYAGSAQFYQDRAKLRMNSDADKTLGGGKHAMAEVAPGTARLRIEGTFDTTSDEAFSESMENNTGPMNTTIKIKVEKID
jgi:hypothetical protein